MMRRVDARWNLAGALSVLLPREDDELASGEKMIQAHDEGRGTVLELRGSFGPVEADRLHDLLRDLDPDEPVTIDFREVRLFHDLAVARLSRDLGRPHVSLLGLSEHHHRLLKYIGLANHPAA